ncbi:alpha/beta hydrolase [Undibacterium oligocarboniphilum]|uniref:Alpha/beta hydrolase n=1 Tax=Undibacterium oligocarboniphilum TaxID=666702 RepID=A0A850QNC9_9BURK|nr:alpha/beta hydrolase [Undibacterium oligocarboniphilum]MBC3871636.1 alpha/beta hydrolase [Undibacterium oligocarboniphilum]NVO79175.1 alpha/beta hydrolase [Undibacterium oligocarboniphilum]
MQVAAKTGLPDILCCMLLFAVIVIGHARTAFAGTIPVEPKPVLQTVTACGADTPVNLDMLTPAQGAAPYPAVLVVHGGGWLSGSRTDLRGLLLQLSRWGILGVSVDYRLAPAARFPAQIEDVKCAVRWLRAHAAEYGIQADRIGALGISAGAHLVALAALTAGQWEQYGDNPRISSALRCAVMHAPPLNLPAWWDEADPAMRGPMSPRVMLNSLFGADYAEAKQAYRMASPANYTRFNRQQKQTIPAMLLIQGEQDVTVPVSQSRQFAAQLRQAGVALELMTLADGDHFTFGSQGPQVGEKIRAFLTGCLK